jgi:hypothetical protein
VGKGEEKGDVGLFPDPGPTFFVNPGYSDVADAFHVSLQVAFTAICGEGRASICLNLL